MKERPILFSAPMVRAILAGTKTQTRRVVTPMRSQEWLSPDTLAKSPRAKPCIIDGEQWAQFAHPKAGLLIDGIQHDEWSPLTCIRCPYGQPGDRLWVRETFCVWGDGRIEYRANPEFADTRFERDWKPSIHMPRWASRILLEIISVRVERLQEITNDDARAEGPEYAHPHRHGTEGLEWEPHPGEIVRDSYAARHNTGWNDCWICAYRQIWESINGPGSWDANPWVWVIEFKRVTS